MKKKRKLHLVFLKKIIPTFTHGGSGVMVWDGFAVSGSELN